MTPPMRLAATAGISQYNPPPARDGGEFGNADQYCGDRVGREPLDVSSHARRAGMGGAPVQYEQSGTG
jgi:hypothetical protein